MSKRSQSVARSLLSRFELHAKLVFETPVGGAVFFPMIEDEPRVSTTAARMRSSLSKDPEFRYRVTPDTLGVWVKKAGEWAPRSH